MKSVANKSSRLSLYSLQFRSLLVLLPITLLLLSTIAYFNIVNTTALFTQAVEDELQTVARSKEAALVEYIGSAERLGFSISATDIVQTYSELTNRKLAGKNQENLDMLARRVANLLYSIQEAHWGRYQHIYLINRSNRIVISPKHGLAEVGKTSALLGRDMSKNPWAMTAFKKGTTRVSDYSVRQGSGDNGSVMFFPVRDVGNRVQTVIGIELQASYQQLILAQGLQMGDSGRVFLTTDRGLPVGGRNTDQQPVFSDATLSRIANGGSWSGLRTNALGNETIGYYSSHAQYPWILAAEIETAEVFGSLYIQHAILIAALLATLAALGVMSWYFARSLARPLRVMALQLRKISLGEFTLEIPEMRRKDEIGDLNVALQRLVFSLRMVSKKLRQAKAYKKAS